MSKYLGSSVSPITLNYQEISDFIYALEEISEIPREHILPKDGDKVVYTRVLFNKLLTALSMLDGQTISHKPLIFCETEHTLMFLGPLVEQSGSVWGSEEKELRPSKSNLMKGITKVVHSRPALTIEELADYLAVVESEADYLDAVIEKLTPPKPEHQKVSEVLSGTISYGERTTPTRSRVATFSKALKGLTGEIDPNDFW